MKNLVLVGYRCTGKTEAGRAVAKRMLLDFVDTDEWVERDSDATVSQIVARHGWPKFRELEKRVVLRASRLTGAVISCGGGVVLDQENVANLKRNGVVVWLGARPEVIFSRMKADDKSDELRPALSPGKDEMQEIREKLVERRALYSNAADFKIDTSDLSLGEVEAKVFEIAGKYLS